MVSEPSGVSRRGTEGVTRRLTPLGSPCSAHSPLPTHRSPPYNAPSQCTNAAAAAPSRRAPCGTPSEGVDAMAEEHVGPRPAAWAWTRIFSGFKVALDLKKLLLAAAGILATW